MISFRFHLVSLIAVFLALALGIGMGVTVVDRVGVDRLQGRLDQVRSEVGAANQRSDRLQSELQRSENYEKQTAPYLIDGQLTNTPVTILGVRGVDEGSVDSLRKSISQAGGRVQGTLWVTSRADLSDPAVVRQLQQALSVPTGDVAQLRSALVARIGAVMNGAAPTSALSSVISTGALEWEAGPGRGAFETVDVSDAKVVVVSGAGAVVSSDVFAVPLVKLIAAGPVRRVVAVEPIVKANNNENEPSSVFVDALRSDTTVDGRISTVDHLDRVAGQVATVLSLAQLPGSVGDYGVGTGALAMVPERNP